jgi:DNA-binding transcriptional MerR regulator
MTASPGKKYFRIGEVSKLTGLDPHILRYWESEFPQIKPHRIAGQRLFTKKDIDLIQYINELLNDYGMTLTGAKRIISEKKRVCVFKNGEIVDIINNIKQELIEIRDRLKPCH